MSSASRGSRTRRRMKLRSRDRSRFTMSAMSSCVATRYLYRRIRGLDIVGCVREAVLHRPVPPWTDPDPLWTDRWPPWTDQIHFGPTGATSEDC